MLYKHASQLDLVVDRLVLRDGIEKRLADSLEVAARAGQADDQGRDSWRWCNDAGAITFQSEFHLRRLWYGAGRNYPESVFVQQPGGGVPGVQRHWH